MYYIYHHRIDQQQQHRMKDFSELRLNIPFLFFAGLVSKPRCCIDKKGRNTFSLASSCIHNESVHLLLSGFYRLLSFTCYIDIDKISHSY